VRRSAAIVIAASVLAALIGQGGAAESPASKAAPLASAPAPPARPPSTQAPAPPPPPERPPPYEPQLLRLAELLGSLAYLRDLCGLGDSAEFRAKMAALLDAESLEQRRNLLAGAYNKGFRDYATSYRVCGPAANAVIERYLNETARLAADLASRYGG